MVVCNSYILLISFDCFFSVIFRSGHLVVPRASSIKQGRSCSVKLFFSHHSPCVTTRHSHLGPQEGGFAADAPFHPQQLMSIAFARLGRPQWSWKPLRLQQPLRRKIGWEWLGGESMASAVLSTVDFYSTSAVETDAPLRTAAPQIVQLSRPNMANHAVVNCCHILF